MTHFANVANGGFARLPQSGINRYRLQDIVQLLQEHDPSP